MGDCHQLTEHVCVSPTPSVPRPLPSPVPPSTPLPSFGECPNGRLHAPSVALRLNGDAGRVCGGAIVAVSAVRFFEVDLEGEEGARPRTVRRRVGQGRGGMGRSER